VGKGHSTKSGRLCKSDISIWKNSIISIGADRKFNIPAKNGSTSQNAAKLSPQNDFCWLPADSERAE
jgi:hypothetical protein